MAPETTHTRTERERERNGPSAQNEKKKKSFSNYKEEKKRRINQPKCTTYSIYLFYSILSSLSVSTHSQGKENKEKEIVTEGGRIVKCRPLVDVTGADGGGREAIFSSIQDGWKTLQKLFLKESPPLPFSIGKRAKAIQMFFIFIIEKGPARESGRIYPCPFKKKRRGMSIMTTRCQCNNRRQRPFLLANGWQLQRDSRAHFFLVETMDVSTFRANRFPNCNCLFFLCVRSLLMRHCEVRQFKKIKIE